MNDICRQKTISFSGHRSLQLTDGIYDKLGSLLEIYIQNGFDTFLIGMAKGFDLICGLTVIKLQEKYSNIKIIPIVPCDNQTDDFSYTEMIAYKKIMTAAHEIIQTGKSRTAHSMHKRNRFMVDNSSVLICYLNYKKSGTYYTCNYAYKNGLEVINISDDNMNKS